MQPTSVPVSLRDVEQITDVQKSDMRYWALSWEAAADQLDVDPKEGLSESEAEARRHKYGANELRAYKPQSLWSIFFRQFKSLIVVLLVFAAVVAFAFGETVEGWAIVIVIALNTLIGFVVELRAIRSMEALYAMSRVHAHVKRNGVLKQAPAEALVPGDVVHIEGGDVIAADIRLLKASKLQADESALTGESLPVGKAIEPVDESAVLAERSSMLYKGTYVSRGTGEGIVTATGMRTELGTITSLVMEAEEESTPLEKRLEQLGHKLIAATLGIVVLVTLSGILSGKELFLMIQTGISLAVAAIPEGLPVVATLALARGVHLMARRNALINRLASVETLGATSVIFTDKTGTLTENKMTVTLLALPEGDVGTSASTSEEWIFQNGEAGIPSKLRSAISRLLEIGVLCNTAHINDQKDQAAFGDPLEIALLNAGRKMGIEGDTLRDTFTELREEAFDPELKLMATFHQMENAVYVAVKGAPEVVLEASSEVATTEGKKQLTAVDRNQWMARNEALAGQGLRVIALASKTVSSPDAAPYENLVFYGLAGLSDPPRTDVRQAIDRCRTAGIQVVMVTGDQPATARRIGRLTGILDDDEGTVIEGSKLTLPAMDDSEAVRRLLNTSIFARVNPKQKLDLIEVHQKNGRIVAMTGDGVNDAPGLKKADIGIAMGQRGTEVAREAADMVLQDDAFSTIVEAVKQGRIIFTNIRRFAFYLMSCNVSEVMVVGLAAAAGATLPIMPLQILFLNLVTDVFPALSLGVGRGDDSVLESAPRNPEEPFLQRKHWLGITAYGVVFSLSVLGALWIALTIMELPREKAITISFLTLAFAQLWHVFNMRSKDSSLFSNDITRNGFVWAALLLCASLTLLAVFIPALAEVLHLERPDAQGWIVILSMSIIPVLAGQAFIVSRRFFSRT